MRRSVGIAQAANRLGETLVGKNGQDAHVQRTFYHQNGTPAGAAFWASFGRNVAETPMASPLRLSRDWPSRLVIDADNSQGFIRALVIQAVWRQRPTSHGLTGTKLLLGTFDVEGIDEGTPAEMWKRYRARGGIDSDVFQRYFSSAPRAFAIKVGRVFRLPQPARLSTLECTLPVPQSYYYVDTGLMESLMKLGGNGVSDTGRRSQ